MGAGKSIVAIALAMMTGLVVAAGVNQYLITNVNNTGVLVAPSLGLLINGNATDTIDWGNVSAGGTYIANLTITNVGTVNTTIVYLAFPPANLTETFDANNTFLQPAQVVMGNLTLWIPESQWNGTQYPLQWMDNLTCVS
jgi:hypothetical protein